MDYTVELVKLLDLAITYDPYPVRIFADYPEASIADLLTLESEGGSIDVVINVLDGGKIGVRTQFAAQDAVVTCVQNIAVFATNPLARNFVGEKIFGFFMANPGFSLAGQDWKVNRVRDNGYLSSSSGIYGRSYSVWIGDIQNY